MSRLKFDHFEMFKIVLNVLYIAGGIFIFSVLIANAVPEFGISEVKIIDFKQNKQIECENCDEID
jgi:hypothetical protein